MHIKTIRTHAITSADSIVRLIDSYIPKMDEKSVLVVTSKVISLCEGNVVPYEQVSSKKELVRKHADAFLNEESTNNIQLTIKNHLLIPSAGIDESNGNGVYILYPKDVQESAFMIWQHLRQRDSIKELGVLITDSHSTPMRRGVMGIGLGWCGFKPLYNYIGKPDCFGKPLRITKTNVVDSLSAAAVFCMGEGNEQTPFAMLREVPKVEFLDERPSSDEMAEFFVSQKEDMYRILWQNQNWVYN